MFSSATFALALLLASAQASTPGRSTITPTRTPTRTPTQTPTRTPAGSVAPTASASVHTAPSPVTLGAVAEELKVEVVAAYPHDPKAFTQGLLMHGGLLYESTGLVGRSSLREVDTTTGKVRRMRPLPPPYFGEGLALVGEELIQLTWTNDVAFRYDRATFSSLGQFSYSTQGWGLCYDGQRLVMTDGSSTLYFRDPSTFDLVGSVTVKLNGSPVNQLNELECTGGVVYSNVWTKNTILRIDPTTGNATARIDASGLLTPAERAGTDVLNGIAADPETGEFLITGKLWPKLFRVRFVPR